MEYRRFPGAIVIRIDRGEEIVEQLKAVCAAENVQLASVSALGAINEFTIGAWDVENRKYLSNSYTGVYELSSLVGSVTTMNGETYLHLHANAGDGQGHVVGGHLNRAIVSATCEMIVHLIDGRVERTFDPATGLNLFAF